ncbi:formyltetrahydrofolate deformylase [Micromonospora sp. CA-246542]|uniref:formyltetrahydrofolate deformylase n=1 Tax=Micromonospora sp. CA-246542 TaxID=3239959 RepID=UPI003D8EE761
MPEPVQPDYVLTLACDDRRGIVREVTGFLADQRLSISESQQFADTAANRFFMRVQARGEPGPADVERIRKEFEPVAESFRMQWQLHDLSVPHRVLVMVSRYGHCLNDLLFRAHTGALPVEVSAVVSNHVDLADIARWHGVPFHHVPVTAEGRTDAEAELVRLIDTYSADTLVLARYMQILSPQLCRRLAGRVINIHHSLLPSFKGASPYRRAHERGVKVIGATAHYVTADLDEGPIIEQDFARADHRFTPEKLAALNHDLEARALARAVKWHAERRVILSGQRTVVFS